MEYKNTIQINVFQNRSRLTDIENKLTVSKGEGKRNKLGVWDLEIHITVYKTEKKQEFTYSAEK